MRGYTCKNIDYILGFGKHKNKSIREVYQGKKKIAKSEITKIAIDVLKHMHVGQGPIEIISFPLDSPNQVSFLESLVGNDVSEGNRVLFENNGYPDYIEWCILNMPSFCIEKTEFAKLKELLVYSIDTLNVRNLFFDSKSKLYKFVPELVINNRMFTFSAEARNVNNRKNA